MSNLILFTTFSYLSKDLEPVQTNSKPNPWTVTHVTLRINPPIKLSIQIIKSQGSIEYMNVILSWFPLLTTHHFFPFIYLGKCFSTFSSKQICVVLISHDKYFVYFISISIMMHWLSSVIKKYITVSKGIWTVAGMVSDLLVQDSFGQVVAELADCNLGALF